MAKSVIRKSNAPAPNDYYNEERYMKTISKVWREKSGDNTPVKGKYVSFMAELNDFIDKSDDEPKGANSKIKDITYDPTTQTIIVTKDNGKKIVIPISDNYLIKGKYDPNAQSINMQMEDGNVVNIATEELENKFYTQEEVDEKLENTGLYWGEF